MRTTAFPEIATRSTRAQVEFERGSLEEQPNWWLGLVAGIAAGLVASAAMNGFQSLITQLTEPPEKKPDPPNHEQGAQQQKTQPQAQKRQTPAQSEPATVIAAERLSKGLFNHRLRKSEKETAGQIMHYIMGAASGAIYGISAEWLPEIRLAWGAAFGGAVWIVADEITVPILGLSKAPTDYPPSVHLKALAAHLVFGTASETVRRIIRSIL